MKSKDVGAIVALVAVIAFAAFGVWAHYAGPCGLYKFAKAGDVPARCVMK